MARLDRYIQATILEEPPPRRRHRRPWPFAVVMLAFPAAFTLLAIIARAEGWI